MTTACQNFFLALAGWCGAKQVHYNFCHFCTDCLFSVAVRVREGAPVGDHHAAPDGGRDGAAPPAARRLPAQLLAAPPPTEHRQGSHNLLTLTLKS